MTELQQNRRTLYDNLLNDGYFKDEDGNINFPYEEFDESLDDNENIVTLYRNLLDDGYFRDEDGEINFSEADFLAMLGRKHEIRTYYPLTGNQLGIYADWEMNRDTTQYNIPTLTRYTGVEVGRLVEALRRVVDAHPYLKMRLAETPDGVMQQRRDDAETKIEVRKLQVDPGKEYFQALVQPFDLFNDDLYRIVVVETPSAVYFWKDMHHILLMVDRWVYLMPSSAKHMQAETYSPRATPHTTLHWKKKNVSKVISMLRRKLILTRCWKDELPQLILRHLK